MTSSRNRLIAAEKGMGLSSTTSKSSVIVHKRVMVGVPILGGRHILVFAE